jgi:hypothetical protein
LYYSEIKVLLDATVRSKHGKIIKCDLKPGSVERSTNLDRVDGAPQQEYFQNPLPIKTEKFHSGNLCIIF